MTIPCPPHTPRALHHGPVALSPTAVPFLPSPGPVLPQTHTRLGPHQDPHCHRPASRAPLIPNLPPPQYPMGISPTTPRLPPPHAQPLASTWPLHPLLPNACAPLPVVGVWGSWLRLLHSSDGGCSRGTQGRASLRRERFRVALPGEALEGPSPRQAAESWGGLAGGPF